jgi:hypothetical protein
MRCYPVTTLALNEVTERREESVFGAFAVLAEFRPALNSLKAVPHKTG